MAFETIRFEVDGAVATITLARPEAANAQSSLMIEELDAAGFAELLLHAPRASVSAAIATMRRERGKRGSLFVSMLKDT